MEIAKEFDRLIKRQKRDSLRVKDKVGDRERKEYEIDLLRWK